VSLIIEIETVGDELFELDLGRHLEGASAARTAAFATIVSASFAAAPVVTMMGAVAAGTVPAAALAARTISWWTVACGPVAARARRTGVLALTSRRPVFTWLFVAWFFVAWLVFALRPLFRRRLRLRRRGLRRGFHSRRWRCFRLNFVFH
jgi:hypothetical protein